MPLTTRYKLKKLPLTSIYNLPLWGRVVSVIGYKKKVFLVKKNNKICCSLTLYSKNNFLVKKLVSLPIGDWPASFHFNTEEISKVLKKVKTFVEKHKVFLRIYALKVGHLPTGLFQTDSFFDYQIDVNQDYKILLAKVIHKKTRNMIKKSLKKGIVVEIAGKKDLADFYFLYLKTMKKLGEVALPKNIFDKTWRELKENNLLLKAKIGSQTVGYLWIFFWQNSAWVWANATNEKYLPQGTNYALYNQTIKIACQKKQTKFLYLGMSGKNTSQGFFKSRWGGKKITVYQISNQSMLNSNSRLFQFKFVLKRMPFFLYKLASKMAYNLF